MVDVAKDTSDLTTRLLTPVGRFSRKRRLQYDDESADHVPHSKRRRVRRVSIPIDEAAKYYRLDKSQILEAYKEPSGFRWFRRDRPCMRQLNQSKANTRVTQGQDEIKGNGILREMSREEWKARSQNEAETDTCMDQSHALDKLQLLRDKLQMRKVTQPPKTEIVGPKSTAVTAKAREKADDGHKKGRKKKIVKYKKVQEVVKKKKLNRRLVKKPKKPKKVKVTTTYSPVKIPDYPAPDFPMDEIFGWNDAKEGIQQFEVSLTESCLQIVSKVYGTDGPLSFITNEINSATQEYRSNMHNFPFGSEKLALLCPGNDAPIALAASCEVETTTPTSGEVMEEEGKDSEKLQSEMKYVQRQCRMLHEYNEKLRKEIEYNQSIDAQMDDEAWLTSVFTAEDEEKAEIDMDMDMDVTEDTELRTLFSSKLETIAANSMEQLAFAQQQKFELEEKLNKQENQLNAMESQIRHVTRRLATANNPVPIVPLSTHGSTAMLLDDLTHEEEEYTITLDNLQSILGSQPSNPAQHESESYSRVNPKHLEKLVSSPSASLFYITSFINANSRNMEQSSDDGSHMLSIEEGMTLGQDEDVIMNDLS